MHKAKKEIKFQIHKFLKMFLESNYYEKSLNKELDLCEVLADDAKC